jgi:hypothetical protein
MTNPFLTSDLLKSPSNYPVVKGDVMGHEFHGNQYQTASGRTAQDLKHIADQLFKEVNPSSRLQSGDGKTTHAELADKHQTLADEHYELAEKAEAAGDGNASRLHEDAAALHQEAALHHERAQEEQGRSFDYASAALRANYAAQAAQEASGRAANA